MILSAAALFVACSSAAAQNWYFPHFSGSNSSFFLTVQTAPAAAGSISVPNIGTFANGAGPVIGPDGTLYIGNEQGRLMAFGETGTPVWNVALSGGEGIVASAMVWNGDIYVVGATGTNAALYRFRPDGTQVYRRPFPQHRSGGIMTTAPNISFAGPTPVVVLPVAYKTAGSQIYETRLLLFTENGQPYQDILIDIAVPQTTGSFGSASIAPGAPDLELPLPMAAAATDHSTGVSYIAVADGFQTLTVYRTNNSGLAKAAQWQQRDRMRSFTVTPYLDPKQIIAFNSKGYLVATPDGANEYRIPDYPGHAPPALTYSTAFSVFGNQVTFRNPNGPRSVAIPGRSIAPVAVSQNYAYVSSEDALTTYKSTPEYEQVARFDWVGGGRNPPIIGANGRVYAIASNILFIFPPPKTVQNAFVPNQQFNKTTGQSANAAPQAPQTTQPSQPASQIYNPPLTVNGNRLFACEELDQDNCGKGDYKSISLAWCQKQGFPRVKNYDVDSRKVRAESLDGQFCSKNKCKVFDRITCQQ
ncbi:MAG: hypothetical protein R3D05_04795 [Dongiaceae bacterium]